MSVFIFVRVVKNKNGQAQDITGVFIYEEDAKYAMKNVFHEDSQFYKNLKKLKTISESDVKCEFTTNDDTIFIYYVIEKVVQKTIAKF